MHQYLSIFILAVYLLSLCVIGWVGVTLWFKRLPMLPAIVGAFLLGTGVGIPITYVVSCLFRGSGDPIGWGVGSVILLAVLLAYSFRHRLHPALRTGMKLGDFLLIAFALVAGYWIIGKTFHGGPAGQLFVGSNNVFDFGHALGIIRSFSWGSRLPLSSPFQAGLPFLYHFFFYFWVAIWEYFGVPIVWAMNIPSILSFAAFLIMVYWVPQSVARQGVLTGWVAVCLTLTNSSLAFWNLMVQKGVSTGFIRYIWQLPTYPFAGPFDGSTISLFVTLNNFVNQRFLAFAIACGLFIFCITADLVASKQMTVKKAVLLGAAVGLLFLWNMAVFFSVAVVIGLLFLVYRQWKLLIGFCAAAAVLFAVSVSPIIPYLPGVIAFFNTNVVHSAAGSHPVSWNMLDYIWQNLGLLPGIAGLGFIVLSKKTKVLFVPFVVGFISLLFLAAVGHRGFDQKFFSFFIIWVNVLAAIALTWMWKKHTPGIHVLALVVFGILTISGVVDVMPIKNEFAYPLIGPETAPVVAWVHASTPKEAVFISYSDIIDPVVLAGRRNFYGFFGNIGSIDRTPIVSQVYAGHTEIAKANNISYVVVPKWQKNDFTYVVDITRFRKAAETVYEDDRYIVFHLN